MPGPASAAVDGDALHRRLTGWCRTRFGSPGLELGPFAVPGHGGFSHETLLADVHGLTDVDGLADVDGLVFRLAPRDVPLFPDADLDDERRVLDAVGASGAVPVPRVLGVEPDPAVAGRPFFVMARVDGRVPPDDPPYQLAGWLHDAAPAEQRAVVDGFLDALGALGRIDPAGLDPELVRRLGPPGVDGELARGRRYLDWIGADGPLPVLEAALAWCEAHRPPAPPPDTLSWGDARLGNVIVGDDLRPAALLDWETAAVAPPEADLGWFLFLHDTTRIWIPDLPGFPTRDAMVERYAAALGREPVDLAWYEVWAGVRAAMIQARLVARRGGPPSARQDSPVVASLRRRIDLPDP